MSRAANILRSTKDSEGNPVPHWTELSSQVNGFNNALELTDKVRDVVVGGRYQFTPLVIFRQVGDTIVTALVFKTH